MENSLAKRAARPEEIAAIYGFSMGSLANMRAKKEGPRYFKQGRRVFYFIDDFELWLRSQPHLTEDSVGDPAR